MPRTGDTVRTAPGDPEWPSGLGAFSGSPRGPPSKEGRGEGPWSACLHVYRASAGAQHCHEAGSWTEGQSTGVVLVLSVFVAQQQSQGPRSLENTQEKACTLQAQLRRTPSPGGHRPSGGMARCSRHPSPAGAVSDGATWSRRRGCWRQSRSGSNRSPAALIPVGLEIVTLLEGRHLPSPNPRTCPPGLSPAERDDARERPARSQCSGGGGR